MQIRAHVLSTHPEGGGILRMVEPCPGAVIVVGPREAACLVEWRSGGPGEPFEISDEVARREGLLPPEPGTGPSATPSPGVNRPRRRRK